MEKWQVHFAEKGYSYDNGRLLAVATCRAEIKAAEVEAEAAKKRSSPTSK